MKKVKTFTVTWEDGKFKRNFKQYDEAELFYLGILDKGDLSVVIKP